MKTLIPSEQPRPAVRCMRWLGITSRRGALKALILGAAAWVVGRSASAAEQPKPPLYIIGFDPGYSGGDRAVETVWRVEEGGKRLVLVRQRMMPNGESSDRP